MNLYKTIANYYDQIFPLKQSKIDFFSDYSKNKKVLEIGCATGNLCFELSKTAKQVVGIDLSSELISNAKEKHSSENLEFKLESLTNILSLNNCFDTIICVGNTLPHLSSIAEVENFIKNSFEILNKNGHLILQFINFPKLMLNKHFDFPELKNKSFEFKRSYKIINNSFIEFNTELYLATENKKFSDATKLLPLDSKKIIKYAESIGFTVEDTFSNFNRDKFSHSSDAIIIILKREI